MRPFFKIQNNLDHVISLLLNAQSEVERKKKEARASLFDVEEQTPFIFFTPKHNRTRAVLDLDNSDGEYDENDDDDDNS